MVLYLASFYLIHLVLLLPALASAELNISLPGCKTHCGNVAIPYPFGIGISCALNPGFNISCNTLDFNPPKVFRRDLEVYSISDSKLRISNAVSRQCYNASGELIRRETNGFLLGETAPVTFSEANKFFLVGCDDSISISGSRKNLNFTFSCLSFCSEAGDVINGSCSGIGCCQSSIPAGIKYFDVSMSAQQNHRSVWPYNQCGYAFLGEETQFDFRGLSDLNDPGFLDRINNARVPLVLDWAIGNLTCKEAENANDYVCKGNSSCVDTSSGGYRCHCKQGYEGNPYLNDCQDIDECADPNKHDCAMSCTNTPGSYNCWCPHRFIGDGHKNSTGCSLYQAKFPVVNLILGVGFGILSLFTVIPCLYLTIKRRKLIKLREKFFKQNGGILLNQHFSTRKKGEKSPRVFQDEELRKATNNYAEERILGRGGSGIVYKGNIDKREVAIKKAKIVSQNQIEQFINEVIILTQVNHRHVVELIGCCLETEVPSLVYEFISNGTLSNHIHNSRNEEKNQDKWDFSWEDRLRIAGEAAGALAYLHSAASTPLIHGDVKSANILLDENYTAKIADFGASRLVPLDQTLVMTLVQWTFGYLDPECLRSHHLTEKSDVYSFGVVLAELLTGKRPVFKDTSGEQEINLATYFVISMEENCLLEILEPRILSEETSDRLQEIGFLVKKCLSLISKERPTMKEVANELDKLRNSNKCHHSGQQDHGANKLLPSERHMISVYHDNTNTHEEESETSQLFFSAKST